MRVGLLLGVHLVRVNTPQHQDGVRVVPDLVRDRDRAQPAQLPNPAQPKQARQSQSAQLDAVAGEAGP
jgi:hypothetical protein